ncbi:MAG: Rpn family recombination-promoting nuclease/putative transposase [Lachnospiraceae bacterium]|nr:Rpn family recombination-promoting nuclease/putative transposase [Lachnospiraceae bacterium]
MTKQFEQLDFQDWYIFGRVMEDPELCHDFLATLLQEEIGALTSIVREKELEVVVDGKRVRMDIYATEEAGPIYNAEMQNRNKQKVEELQLPLRSRAYQSLIDNDLLDRKTEYKDLPDSNVIFICTFDPFGEGKYRYAFQNTCEENTELKLADRTRKIFFNATSQDPDMPVAIRALFDYIMEKRVEDKLTERIDGAVEHIKRSSSERSFYMKNAFRYLDMRDEARAEGLEEGREEGRAEGRAEGRVIGFEEGKASVIEDALRNGKTCEEIAEFHGLPVEYVKKIEEQMLSPKQG